MLTKGENVALSEDIRQAFTEWYKNQNLEDITHGTNALRGKFQTINNNNYGNPNLAAGSSILKASVPGKSPSQVVNIVPVTSTNQAAVIVVSEGTTPPTSAHKPLSSSYPATASQLTSTIANSYPALRNELNSGLYKTRIRTSFDPENEIPRLHRWFSENSHPNRDQMIGYLTELNRLDSRAGKKPLDLTNIIYWFKNARAAHRRALKRTPDDSSSETLDQSSVLDASGDAVVVHMLDMESSEADLSDERLSPGLDDDIPPVLPNKNAVYMMTNPYHNRGEQKTEMPGVDEDSPVISIYPREPGSDDSDDDNRLTIDESEGAGNKRKASSLEENGVEHGDEENMMKDDYVVVSSKKGTKKAGEDVVKVEPDSDTDGSNNNNNSVKKVSVAGTAKIRAIAPLPSHMALASAIQSPLNMHYLNPVAHALYGLPPPANATGAPTTTSHILTPASSPLNMSASDLSPGELDRKKRSRVFIDPLSEIPQLEQWFEEDTHPSSYMIEKYTSHLNNSDYRQRFPPLEAKNVQLWFKNHRAKVKRARFD